MAIKNLVIFASMIFAAVLAQDATKNLVSPATQCALVGRNSGCSGCELGMKGLCHDKRFVGYTGVNIYPESRDSPVVYLCLSKEESMRIETRKLGFWAKDICPTDLNNESEDHFKRDLATCIKYEGFVLIYYGIILGGIETLRPEYYLVTAPSTNYTANFNCNDLLSGSSLPVIGTLPPNIAGTLPRTISSTIFSSSHSNGKLAIFPRQPWPVDRTSLWEKAGQYSLWTLGGALAGGSSTTLLGTFPFKRRSLSDAELSNTLLSATNQEGLQQFPGGDFLPTCADMIDPNQYLEERLLHGCIRTQRDRVCARKFMETYYSFRCPEYGVPYTGVCYSVVASLLDYCSGSDLSIRPGRLDLLIASIVPDVTPHCLRELPVKLSGIMEKRLGFHVPLEEVGANDFCFGTDAASALSYSPVVLFAAAIAAIIQKL